MKIERTEKEIIIRLPADLEVEELQRMLDYFSYKHAIQYSKASEEEIASQTKEAKAGWWEKNQDRFPGL
ncbi:MAG: hypothetical protein AAFR61_20965 [Bacteroidota bacterium]